jgi:hypothetical protein
MDTAMSRAPPPRGGIAGLVLIFCLAAAVAGLGFDFGADDARSFWIGARPGAAAAIGCGGAVFCVLAGQIARFALGRKDAKGSDNAHPDA